LLPTRRRKAQRNNGTKKSQASYNKRGDVHVDARRSGREHHLAKHEPAKREATKHEAAKHEIAKREGAKHEAAKREATHGQRPAREKRKNA
jgi:hypothetical protein